jgi:hypothetical protein
MLLLLLLVVLLETLVSLQHIKQDKLEETLLSIA